MNNSLNKLAKEFENYNFKKRDPAGYEKTVEEAARALIDGKRITVIFPKNYQEEFIADVEARIKILSNDNFTFKWRSQIDIN